MRRWGEGLRERRRWRRIGGKVDGGGNTELQGEGMDRKRKKKEGADGEIGGKGDGCMGNDEERV